MNEIQKKLILDYIVKHDPNGVLIKSIEPADDFIGGQIEYNEKSLKLHRKISFLGDEEYVRAYLIVKLKKELGYGAKEVVFEVEKEYSIGRPSKKSARIDLVVSYPDN